MLAVTLADLTALRRQLRAAVTSGLAPTCSDADDLARLLLAVEELTSNALRHGRPPGAGGRHAHPRRLAARRQ